MATADKPKTDKPTSSSGTMEKKISEDLGYLELPENFGSSGDGPSWMKQEGFRDKFLRKTKENPFVPIGLGLTIGALSYGLYQMKTGDRVMSQRMMRLRVAAQSFTVIALITGVIYQGQKHHGGATSNNNGSGQ